MFILPLLFVSLLIPQALSLNMDNSLIGNPEIKCNADTIEMQFSTKRKFTGKVYVRGHYNNPDCLVDYSRTNADGSPTGGIKLHHGSCDMDRQRTIRPEGMQFSTVLVISFHPLFVTKTDRAFSINCMYREASQTVEQKIDVDNLKTETLQEDMPMPECTYTIRKDEIDGPILKYAKVGDQVVHRWECNSDNYGLLVHSCFVEDGQGVKQEVVNKDGCHTFQDILGDPTYVQALNMAYRESYVFKFADRVVVRFQCAIRLCLKADGGCNDVTPPTCDVGGQNSLARKRRATIQAPKRNVSTFSPTFDADLISQTVYVFEADDDSHKPQPLGIRALSEYRAERLCISSSLFTAVISLTTLLFISIISLIIYIVYRNYRALGNLENPKCASYSPTSLVFK